MSAEQTPTCHNQAKKGDFAKCVLMPGDPLRAKWIAETFLKDIKLVNNVRGVQGYTGTYTSKKDPNVTKRVSVMASGMGIPSIGIYSYELFNFYDVECILRVGTIGSLNKNIPCRDVIVGMGACTDSNYGMQYKLAGTFCPIADFEVLKRLDEAGKIPALNLAGKLHFGNVLSSDTFYNDSCPVTDWAKMGVLGCEMEAAGLYMNAARAGKKAACICTVSNNIITGEETTSQERQNTFNSMMELALEVAISFEP